MKIVILYLILHQPGGFAESVTRDSVWPSMADCETAAQKNTEAFIPLINNKLSTVCVEHNINVNLTALP